MLSRVIVIILTLSIFSTFILFNTLKKIDKNLQDIDIQITNSVTNTPDSVDNIKRQENSAKREMDYTLLQQDVQNGKKDERRLNFDVKIDENIEQEIKDEDDKEDDIKTDTQNKENIKLNENQMYRDVHVFYYPWYANIEHDKIWNHWDHHILPHWDPVVKERHKYGVQYEPPDDIGANFYPLRGPYSSRDKSLLESHMRELSGYVVVVSWWGRTGADGEGFTTDTTLPLILEAASKYGTRIAIHLEPYRGRNAQSVKEDLQYIYTKYGNYASLYRSPQHNNRIIIYVYDSYHTPAHEWASILNKNSYNTIRDTPYDAVMLGLYLTPNDQSFLVDSNFDGFYTYFAASGFTHGSTYTNWGAIADWARQNKLVFSCSVGPGYDDTRIRPWNENNKRERQNGEYYNTQWSSALSARPDFVSVTSYNEWHEGTQIEAAIPKIIKHTIFSNSEYSYSNYLPFEPDYYMVKTGE
jgi:glycoprotein endo-alpha-1,2-mannosidase